MDLGFQFFDFFVFLFLALNEYYRMVETSFVQVLHIVFSQNFNLASEVVIGTLNELVFASVFVLLMTLAQNASPTLIVALDDLEQASLIMRNQIFVHDY